jgi:hypothetical protein
VTNRRSAATARKMRLSEHRRATAQHAFPRLRLVAALRGPTRERIAADRSPFGAVLKASRFAYCSTWSTGRMHGFSFSQFRDKEQKEIDIVIEDDRGHLIDIEVNRFVCLIMLRS